MRTGSLLSSSPHLPFQWSPSETVIPMLSHHISSHIIASSSAEARGMYFARPSEVRCPRFIPSATSPENQNPSMSPTRGWPDASHVWEACLAKGLSPVSSSAQARSGAPPTLQVSLSPGEPQRHRRTTCRKLVDARVIFASRSRDSLALTLPHPTGRQQRGGIHGMGQPCERWTTRDVRKCHIIMKTVDFLVKKKGSDMIGSGKHDRRTEFEQR